MLTKNIGDGSYENPPYIENANFDIWYVDFHAVERPGWSYVLKKGLHKGKELSINPRGVAFRNF